MLCCQAGFVVGNEEDPRTGGDTEARQFRIAQIVADDGRCLDAADTEDDGTIAGSVPRFACPPGLGIPSQGTAIAIDDEQIIEGLPVAPTGRAHQDGDIQLRRQLPDRLFRRLKP